MTGAYILRSAIAAQHHSKRNTPVIWSKALPECIHSVRSLQPAFKIVTLLLLHFPVSAQSTTGAFGDGDTVYEVDGGHHRVFGIFMRLIGNA